MVVEAESWGEFEEGLLAKLRARKVPVIAVFNTADLGQPDPHLIERLETEEAAVVRVSAATAQGLEELRLSLLAAAPKGYLESRHIVGDLVGPGELVVLVVPTGKEAPRGRLILPQVQTIRDLLDSDSFCIVFKERELKAALAHLTRPRRLIVTGSQAFLKVAADTPRGKYVF